VAIRCRRAGGWPGLESDPSGRAGVRCVADCVAAGSPLAVCGLVLHLPTLISDPNLRANWHFLQDFDGLSERIARYG